MELAKETLRERPALALAEVASSVGYRDEAAFNVAFRRGLIDPRGATRNPELNRQCHCYDFQFNGVRKIQILFAVLRAYPDAYGPRDRLAPRPAASSQFHRRRAYA
jgi:hypothetical protein